jgi:hypothetical protein
MRTEEEVHTKLDELNRRLEPTLDPAVRAPEDPIELARVAGARDVLQWVIGGPALV